MGGIISAVLAVLPLVSLVQRLFEKPPARPVAPDLPPGKSLEELVAEARAKLKLDCVNHFNFAVCGPSGVGKSYFVNAVRGVRPGDSGAADVGITETTRDSRRYDMPELPHLKLWDLPGFGTVEHPTHLYVQDKCLIAFDAVLIMYDNRLLEGVVDIVKALEAAHVPCALVRTKADQAVDDLMSDRGLTKDAAKVEVRRANERTIRDNLHDRAGSVRAFLVSSGPPSMWLFVLFCQ